MHLLEIFTKKDLNTILRKREGETKIGETIKFCENEKWEK
jgi:hypothetical protein